LNQPEDYYLLSMFSISSLFLLSRGIFIAFYFLGFFD